MNDSYNIALEDFGWQVLRTPLYPATVVNQAHFFKILKTDLFQQAIYLSSRSLYSSLKKLLQDQLSDKEKKRVTQSLFSYFLRSSYRCTPFGLMAGLALGHITDHTQIVLGEMSRHNKIDAEVLYLLRETLSPSQGRLYHPNPTLYQYDAHTQRYFYREVQHHLKRGYSYQFQYSSVEANEYLALLCQDTSARSLEAYVQQLIGEDIDPESATEFVQDLIEAGLLQESFQISPVGKELQQRILSDTSSSKVLLNNVEQAIQVTDYQTIEKTITSISSPQIPDTDNYIRHFLHVDAERNVAHNSLNKAQVTKITQVVQTLHQVIPARFNPSLTQFREEFNQRYENQQVPLMALIDPENGILYPSGNALKQPYIFNNLGFPQTSQPTRLALDEWQNFLFRTYSQSLLGNKIVKLSSKGLLDTFGSINADHSHYPETLGALVSVLGKDKIQLKNAHLGAGTYLGRFALTNSALEQAVQQITKYEQSTNPEVMYAEIVHAPAHPKTYNILNRPSNIRNYKLVLFADPNLYPDEEVILPKDLAVSVAFDEIVLHHVLTGKRVIPFLTTAHNQRGSNFPAYNFLCDLAYQRTYVGNWNWGALGRCVFLPRVEIDEVVVAPAIWKVKRVKDLAALGVPERFWLTMGDRKLMIDQNCALSRQILQDKLGQGNQEVSIEEYLFEDYVVKDVLGQGYTNEMVVPLKVTNPRKLKVDFKHQPSCKHFLGGSWVYFKIYCGAFTSDELLKTHIPNIIAKLGANVDQWFFIRYKDHQGAHLRIRIKLQRLTSDVFTVIHSALEHHLQKGLISIHFDTYEPEVLRYGGLQVLEICEVIFWEDSKTLIQVLRLLEQDKDQEEEEYLICLAMKNIDYWLQDFGLSLDQRLTFATQVAQGFAQEFKASNHFKKRLNKAYRDYQKKTTDLGDIYEHLFRERSKNLQPLIQQIKVLTAAERNEVTLPQLLNSLIHMSLNRLFKQLPRQQEYITWDFLMQFYKTAMYKNKAKKNKQV
ncbi:MAG TPA: hypothetical protein DCS93_05220 [Microscillaceae bacterium]|nr:hypothetical protein [Microscillaceae bacterium]